MRVLVVENDPEIRAIHQKNLERWGYLPVVAEGVGEALQEDAVAKTRQQRCQIAIVDMRLIDDQDTSDISGLKLVQRLQPIAAIIVSGWGDHQKARNALKTYGAVDFVGKEQGPAELRKAIVEAVQNTCACYRNPEIIWPHNLSSPKVSTMLFPNDPQVPLDEADELLCRMFPKARCFSLELITNLAVSAPRRRSLVFKAQLENNPSYLVIKVARAERIQEEVNKYERFVRMGVRDLFRPTMEAHTVLWDMGGIAYAFIGSTETNAPGWPQNFTTFYQSTSDTNMILGPIRHFFSHDNWGYWYSRDISSLNEPLFDTYDRIWRESLTKACATWQPYEQQRYFPGLSAPLPDPRRWLSEHHMRSWVPSARQAVTHGDLHGDNLFVDRFGNTWPIDFERTGPGPILRDFVELVQDILTRLAQIGSDELGVLYELAMSICASRSPGEAMRLTRMIAQHTEARKAFEVVNAIQQLTYDQARYTDQREYLWGLLLTNLFVLKVLPEKDSRREKVLLFASVISGRLEHWNASIWPPQGWPTVEWVGSQATTAQTAATRGTTPSTSTTTAVFDVFLAHNTQDKQQVEKIAAALKQRGLNPWLDKEQIRPGQWVQDAIQKAIPEVKAAAICVGPRGLGRWQAVELRTFISQCVERGIPVIPVLLPGVDELPSELVFLKELLLVAFSNGPDDPEALQRLIWGITGAAPPQR